MLLLLPLLLFSFCFVCVSVVSIFPFPSAVSTLNARYCYMFVHFPCLFFIFLLTAHMKIQTSARGDLCYSISVSLGVRGIHVLHTTIPQQIRLNGIVMYVCVYRSLNRVQFSERVRYPSTGNTEGERTSSMGPFDTDVTSHNVFRVSQHSLVAIKTALTSGMAPLLLIRYSDEDNPHTHTQNFPTIFVEQQEQQSQQPQQPQQP